MKKFSLYLSFLLFFSAKATFAINSVAVVPFENINKSATYEWLSTGICETLSTDLAKIKDLALVERYQLNKVLDEIKLNLSGLIDESSVQEAGRMLGAKFLVLGAYQLLKDQIRITARFVDVQTGKIEKTAKIDGKLEDIFLLEDQLVSHFIDTFGISTSEDEKMAIKIKPTNNLQAFENYSKGMQLIYTKEEKAALDFLQKATDLDPLYEEAQLAYETYSVTVETNEIYKEAVENVIEKNRAIRKSLEISDRIRTMLKQVFNAYLANGPTVHIDTEHELIEDKVNLKVHARFEPPDEALNRLQNIAEVIGPPNYWEAKKNLLVLQGSGCDWAQLYYAEFMKEHYKYKSPYYHKLPPDQKLEYISGGDCIFSSVLRSGEKYPLARFLRDNWSDCPYLFRYHFILRILDKEGKDVTGRFLNEDTRNIKWQNNYPIVMIRWGSAGFVNGNTESYRRRIGIYSDVKWDFEIRNIAISRVKEIATIQLIPADKIFENDINININMLENPDLSRDNRNMKNILNDKIWEDAIIQAWQKLKFQI